MGEKEVNVFNMQLYKNVQNEEKTEDLATVLNLL